MKAAKSAPGEVDALRAIAAGSHQPREARRRKVTAAWQRGEPDLRVALNAAYRQGTLDERERWERRDSASGRPWDEPGFDWPVVGAWVAVFAGCAAFWLAVAWAFGRWVA